MPRIAISYRRADSAAIAGRIYDRLKARYGEESVFFDIDNIPIGIDFRSHIQATLLRTDVLIALIGSKWTGADGAGAVRIQEKEDPVRVEIETALKHHVPILPVLIDGTKMPGSTELPESFGDFAFLNAADVANGRDFDSHMDRLIRAIDRAGAGSTDADHKTAAAPMVTASPRQHWLDDLSRSFVAPLILLLIGDGFLIMFNANNMVLRPVSGVVSLIFGAVFFWTSRRSWSWASAFAIGLGVVDVAGMEILEGLISGDPIIPETRTDWIEAASLAVVVALGFFAGYALARVARAALERKAAKP